MFDSLTKLGISRLPVSFNEAGVAKEKIYGIRWINDKKNVEIFFDNCISPHFIDNNNIAIIECNENSDILKIFNNNGIVLKELSVVDFFDYEKVSISYPRIHKTSKSLIGLVITVDTNRDEVRYLDYSCEYDFDKNTLYNIRQIEI